MKCPTCVRTNLRSNLQLGGSAQTLLGWAPYYDEDGIYHAHDPNYITEDFLCTRGHKSYRRYRSPCPAAGCTVQPLTPNARTLIEWPP